MNPVTRVSYRVDSTLWALTASASSRPIVPSGMTVIAEANHKIRAGALVHAGHGLSDLLVNLVEARLVKSSHKKRKRHPAMSPDALRKLRGSVRTIPEAD